GKVLCQKSCHSSLLQINSVFLPKPRSLVTIYIKHEKLFFEIIPCVSELDGSLTTSPLNDTYIDPLKTPLFFMK
ncbi:hypothetical protein, partial [Enterococcus faecium]|uniref:hypothetical protein n=1 Tax=Enterococcus faecium TaxID=1352 RepID=UPI003CC5BA47